MQNKDSSAVRKRCRAALMATLIISLVFLANSANAMSIDLPQKPIKAGARSGTVTIRNVFRVSESATPSTLNTVSLASAFTTDGKEVVALKWVKDVSGFWPTWLIGFSSDVGILGQSFGEQLVQAVDMTPEASHTYQVLLSLDLDGGMVAASVTDLDTGKQVYARGLQTTPYYDNWTLDDEESRASGVYACTESSEYEKYLPVNMGWEVATSRSGNAIYVPGHSMETQDRLAVQLDVKGPLPKGIFRVVLEHDGSNKVLSQVKMADGKQIEISGRELPLGDSVLIFEYEENGVVLFRDGQEISIGTAVIQYQPIEIDKDEGLLRSAAQIQSNSDISELPLKVVASVSKMVWDESARNYRNEPFSTRVAFDGAVAVSPEEGEVQVPLQMALPEEPGLWQVKFQLSGPEISVSGSDSERLFSTYPAAEVKPGESFTIAVLGDIQNYSELQPHITTRQVEWLAANARDKNIALTLQTGDLTNHNNALEWERVQNSFGVLRGVMPFVLSIGNHDIKSAWVGGWNRHDDTKIGEYFPASSFPSLGGTWKGNISNSFYELAFGDAKYLVMSLEFGPRDEVLEWANKVVEAYPDDKVILVTHAYTTQDGRLVTPASAGALSPQLYKELMKNDGANDAQQIWDKFLRKHANVTMVFSGHICSPTVPWSFHKGEFGNTVYNFLVCMSDQPNGGDGWLSLFEISPDGTITVDSYSPFLGHGASRANPNDLGGRVYH